MVLFKERWQQLPLLGDGVGGEDSRRTPLQHHIISYQLKGKTV